MCDMFGLEVMPDGTVAAWVARAEGGALRLGSAHQISRGDRWHHLALVRDNVAVTLLVDGAAAASDELSGGVAPGDGPLVLSIGGAARGSAGDAMLSDERPACATLEAPFNGSLCDVVVYNGVMQFDAEGFPGMPRRGAGPAREGAIYELLSRAQPGRLRTWLGTGRCGGPAPRASETWRGGNTR